MKKKVFSKSMAWILSVVMVISIFILPVSVQVSATQNRSYNFSDNYSLTGNGATDIVSVASAQLGKTGSELGYSEQWCADFVSDCALLANQSNAIPASGYCPTLRQNIYDAGGQNVDRYEAQAGDIVFYGNNGADHVEIVYDAYNGNICTYGGNSGSGGSLYSRSVRQHPTQTQSIAYIVRPNYDNNPNLFPGSEDTSYAVPYSEYATHRCDTYNSGGNKESGHYIAEGDYCYIDAVYENGFCHVEYDIPGDRRWAYAWAGDFNIPKKSIPTNARADKNQYWYDLNDTITIWAYADNASDFEMVIDDSSGNRLVNFYKMDGNSYSIPVSKLGGIGDYYFCIIAKNSSGGTQSEWYTIPVVGNPSYSDVRVSNQLYTLEDTVEISVDTICAKGQVIGIDKEGVGRVVTENCEPTYRIPASNLGEGSYSVYFTVYNGSGWIDTNRVEFTITKWPEKATLGAYIGTNFAPTTFGWNATENTTHYALKIWKGTCWDGPSYKEFLVYDTSYVVDLPAGYEAYVDSLNEYGWTPSNVIKFTVEYGSSYDSGDDFYADIMRGDDWSCLSDVDSNVVINNNGNRLWHFTKTSDGGYLIQNVATGKYLDVCNALDEDGCNVQTHDYNGSDAQIWYRYGRWGEYLKPKCTVNRIMDIDRASENAQIWNIEYNDNQKLNIWIYDTFTISYDMNGGVGNISNQVKVNSYDMIISSIVPTKANYEFLGWSRDKNATVAEYLSGTVFTENENTILYAVWKAPLSNTTFLPKTSITLGDSITINAKASGGTGDYTYAVYYKKASAEKWSTAQAYKANSTISFKPAAAVKYDVCVKVKDSKGTIAKQYFTISVTKELVNNSTLSATTVKKGSNVTVTAKATGGTGKYTYGIYYKKATSEKWTTAQSYGTNTAVTIKPAAAVKYDICVKVKDSSGKIVKKYFTLTVTK